MSIQTVHNLMNVAERYEGKFQTVGNLSPTALYELAAPSTPQSIRDAIEEMIVDGQDITVADIRRMKAMRKARNTRSASVRGVGIWGLALGSF